ncbi:uncharacterized protein METZ01_LOCUS253601, partial [marine metagenome]
HPSGSEPGPGPLHWPSGCNPVVVALRGQSRRVLCIRL